MLVFEGRRRRMLGSSSAFFVHLFQKEAQELLDILLVTTLHIPETWQLPNHFIYKFRNKSFTVLLQLIRFQSEPQLVFGGRRVDDTEFSHEHNHGIDQRKVTLEAVCGSTADMVKELIEWHA